MCAYTYIYVYTLIYVNIYRCHKMCCCVVLQRLPDAN